MSGSKIRLKQNSALLPALIEGVSPEVTLTPVANGVQMDVTTKSGTKSALIPKGDKGNKGDKGDKGNAFTYEDFTEAQKTALIQGPIAEAQAAAEQAIEAKGEEVLDSIPADYSDLAGQVSNLNSALNSMTPVKESDAEDVDLDISDPDGNVIVRLQDGHIKVKNFDSEDVAGLEETVTNIQIITNKSPMVKNSSAVGVDLDVSDNAGNVIVRLQDGHIKVKNFDSSELSTTISGIEEDIAEIEEAITPSSPTSVTVDSVSDLLDEIANGETDIILIKNGTYSVLNVEVTRNVQIIGESRTGVILTCDGTTDQVNSVTDRHGIRFQKGGALKNLTFSVNDVKYVMHQDNISTGYDLLVENCTFNRYDDSCGYYFFIGCGCYGTQNLTVKDCSFIFSENTHNRVSYGIYWHNWHLAKSQLNALAANVTMENCGCIGCGMAIIQDLASKDVNDIISVLNCCSTETAPISSGANGYYIGVPNADVPYNVLFIINNKIGNMILQDRSADKYAYLGAVVTNFTT